MLHVVDTPLEASHAGAFLVGGTPSRDGHDLTPLARRCRGRNGRLGCGCRLADRSCVPTPDNLSVPRPSSPPCRRRSARLGLWPKPTDSRREHHSENFETVLVSMSGVPHRFRFASYATPSEIRTPEISQRGLQPSLAPVAFRSLPPPPVHVRVVAHPKKSLRPGGSKVHAGAHAVHAERLPGRHG